MATAQAAPTTTNPIDTAEPLIGGCVAITARRGTMKPCGDTIVANNRCDIHLDRLRTVGV